MKLFSKKRKPKTVAKEEPYNPMAHFKPLVLGIVKSFEIEPQKWKEEVNDEGIRTLSNGIITLNCHHFRPHTLNSYSGMTIYNGIVTGVVESRFTPMYFNYITCDVVDFNDDEICYLRDSIVKYAISPYLVNLIEYIRREEERKKQVIEYFSKLV